MRVLEETIGWVRDGHFDPDDTRLGRWIIDPATLKQASFLRIRDALAKEKSLGTSPAASSSDAGCPGGAPITDMRASLSDAAGIGEETITDMMGELESRTPRRITVKRRRLALPRRAKPPTKTSRMPKKERQPLQKAPLHGNGSPSSPN